MNDQDVLPHVEMYILYRFSDRNIHFKFVILYKYNAESVCKFFTTTSVSKIPGTVLVLEIVLYFCYISKD